MIRSLGRGARLAWKVAQAEFSLLGKFCACSRPSYAFRYKLYRRHEQRIADRLTNGFRNRLQTPTDETPIAIQMGTGMEVRFEMGRRLSGFLPLRFAWFPRPICSFAADEATRLR